MKSLSTSFTLGKASTGDANIEHNNREYLADNIDINRVIDNVIYVRQNIREVYNELFGEALAKYNANQKQPCRRIHDYYKHISEGRREEPYYEIVVQFGDTHNTGIGSENGELAKKMLDEYVRGFKARNPNLKIFFASMHLDEASPHLHIDFIPFYTKGRKNGLSKGVSMKAALDEMGFVSRGHKQNRLVAWENSEREIMEQILQKHGLGREVKNDNSVHESVPEYKESQDAKKLCELYQQNILYEEVTPENIRKLLQENYALEDEKKKLVDEKNSPWKSFFYSDSAKQSFVQAKLNELNIPFRETENGFEAQEIFAEQIRKLEKEFAPTKTSHRDALRETVDEIIMKSKNYDEVLQRLRDSGYEVKVGKYITIKFKTDSQFIRLKSLGEEYSEQAIRNRLTKKQMFETDTDKNIESAVEDSPAYMVQKTIRHYTTIFAQWSLPVRKIKKTKPFSWENCEELNRLAELNKKINEGMTLESLRNEFTTLEKSVADKESQLAELKEEVVYFRDLHKRGERCFKYHSQNETDLEYLAKHNITATNYHRILELIPESKSEIAELERLLPAERERLKDTVDTLGTLENVMGSTFVQSLVDEQKHRLQTVFVPNGIKDADGRNASEVENATLKFIEAGVYDNAVGKKR
jgi:hypothetical protein